MKSTELLNQLLELQGPWQIIKVRDDLGKQQIDVWVGTQTTRGGWFFGPKTAFGEGPEKVWRHINLGTWRCYVHAALPPGTATASLPWCGDEEMPFTRAMSRHIAALLWEGIKFQTICTILEVTVTDLWKFKHALDSGRTGLSTAPAAAAAPAGSAAVAAPAAEPANDSAVPDANDPIWEKLLDGSANIDVRVLSLKLLLTKLRDQMRVITDSEVRMLKACEMQRYFARYEQLLGHELAQLRKL